MQGVLGRSAWHEQYADWCLWGIGFGLGGMLTKLTADKDGRYHVDKECIEGVNLLFDRHAKNPQDSRFIAYFQYLPVEEAVAAYGSKVKDASPHRRGEETLSGALETDEYDVIRLLHYYDRDTYCCFVDDHRGALLTLVDNPHGFIPITIMCGRPMPMTRQRPGIVQKMLSHQDALNAIRRADMVAAQSPTIDIISGSFLDKQQMDEIENAENQVRRVYTNKPIPRDEKPFERIPAVEASATSGLTHERIKEQLSAASGVNEFMRGEVSDGDRTAREVSLVAEQSSGRGSSLKNTFALCVIRDFEITSEVARQFETAPVQMNFKGVGIVLNGSQDFTSEALFDEYSRVVVNPDDLFGSDAKRQVAEKLANLGQLLSYAGIAPGAVDPNKVVEMILEAQGVDPASIKPDAGIMGPGMQPAPMDQSLGGVPAEQQIA
jgi:hypothetical protein